jgi:hypothetical protein
MEPFEFLNSPAGQWLITWSEIIFTLIFLFFFGVIVFCLKNSNFIQVAYLQDLIELKNQRAMGSGKMEKEWQQIAQKLDSPNLADWKVAILEAEKMVEDVLARTGYSGENFSDRLKKAGPETLSDLEGLLASHQVRNNIVHDPDYRLEIRPASQALGAYEKALKDLEAL